jgi:hypothetical protein
MTRRGATSGHIAVASPGAMQARVCAARAAAAWALAFAAMSFFWAAGGTLGVHTLGPAIERHAEVRDSGFLALVWVTGALKLFAGLVALALAGRPRLPRWVVLVVQWAAWALLVYETAELGQHVLMQTGAIATPQGLGADGVRWHLMLWDPWWIVGAALFAVASWRPWRRERAARGG